MTVESVGQEGYGHSDISVEVSQPNVSLKYQNHGHATEYSISEGLLGVFTVKTIGIQKSVPPGIQGLCLSWSDAHLKYD